MGQYKSRLVASLLAATMVLSPVVSVASNLEREEDTQEKITVQRISGDNRIETSLKVAKKLGVNNKAFYASGKALSDALSIGTIAAKENAPIILGENSEEVIKEMKKLGINEVVIVGGKGSVSEEEEKAIKDNIDAEAKRLSGKDRYETSKAILNEYKITNVGIVGGEAYADALTANPHLAQKDNGVYLMDSSSKLDDGFKASVTIGGENSVKELFGEKRLSGKDRYATAAAIANEFEDFDTVVIADGRNFADALSASPLAANLGAPIVLTNGKEVPEEVKEIIAKAKKAIIVGGESSVPKEVINEIDGKLILEDEEDAKLKKEIEAAIVEEHNKLETAQKEYEAAIQKEIEKAIKDAEDTAKLKKEIEAAIVEEHNKLETAQKEYEEAIQKEIEKAIKDEEDTKLKKEIEAAIVEEHNKLETAQKEYEATVQKEIEKAIKDAEEKEQIELVDKTKEEVIEGKLNSLNEKSIEEQGKILKDILTIKESMSREINKVLDEKIDKAIDKYNEDLEAKEKEAKDNKENLNNLREELKQYRTMAEELNIKVSEKSVDEMSKEEVEKEIADLDEKIDEAKKTKEQIELVDRTKEEVIEGKLNSLNEKSIDEQGKILKDILTIKESMSREINKVLDEKIDKAIDKYNEDLEAKEKEVKDNKENLNNLREELKQYRTMAEELNIKVSEKSVDEMSKEEVEKEIADLDEKIDEAKKTKEQIELVDKTKEEVIEGKLNSLNEKSIDEKEAILENIDVIVKGMSRGINADLANEIVLAKENLEKTKEEKQKEAEK